MERQYVGARYVPVFAEPLEWDNQRSFEALTIVSYLGSSYTSKKAVPSGVLPTNTEYWVQTGNYNAQVEQYRQEVNNLRETLNPLYGKTIAVYGSSNEVDASYNSYKSWVTRMAEKLAPYNVVVVNKSVGGTHIIEGIDAYLADTNKDTYDITIFCNLRNAYNAHISLFEVYSKLLSGTNNIGTPTNQIYFAETLPHITGTNPSKYGSVALYDGVAHYVAGFKGYKWLDMRKCLTTPRQHLSEYLAPDLVHYNALANEVICNNVITMLMNGGSEHLPYYTRNVHNNNTDVETNLGVVFENGFECTEFRLTITSDLKVMCNMVVSSSTASGSVRICNTQNSPLYIGPVNNCIMVRPFVDGALVPDTSVYLDLLGVWTNNYTTGTKLNITFDFTNNMILN